MLHQDTKINGRLTKCFAGRKFFIYAVSGHSKSVLKNNVILYSLISVKKATEITVLPYRSAAESGLHVENITPITQRYLFLKLAAILPKKIVLTRSKNGADWWRVCNLICKWYQNTRDSHINRSILTGKHSQRGSGNLLFLFLLGKLSRKFQVQLFLSSIILGQSCFALRSFSVECALYPDLLREKMMNCQNLSG